MDSEAEAESDASLQSFGSSCSSVDGELLEESAEAPSIGHVSGLQRFYLYQTSLAGSGAGGFQLQVNASSEPDPGQEDSPGRTQQLPTDQPVQPCAESLAAPVASGQLTAVAGRVPARDEGDEALLCTGLTATALHWAAIRGDPDIVKNLLDVKADVNAQTISYCCRQESAPERVGKTTELLIAAKADLNVTDSVGITALAWAVSRTFDNVESGDEFDDESDNEICFKNPSGVSLALIQAGADFTCATGPTLLERAINRGNQDIINAVLLAIKEPHVNAACFAHTPLHYAARLGKLDVISALISHGADINSQRAFLEQTPLMSLMYNHSIMPERVVKITELLIAAKADLDVVDELGTTALGWAVCRRYPNVESNDESSDESSDTQILSSYDGCNYRNPAGVSLALIQAGADFTLTDDSEDSVLERAIRRGDHDIIEAVLLALKEPHVNDNIVCWDDDRCIVYGTPLHYAVKLGKPHIVSAMISHGANLNAQIEDESTPGSTPLISLLYEGINIKPENTVEITELLIAAKADLDIVDEVGITALGWAVSQQCGDCESGAQRKYKNPARVSLALIEAGADFTLSEDSDASVLERAIRRGDHDIIEAVLLALKEPHVNDNIVYWDDDLSRDETPLHYAVKLGKPHITPLMALIHRHGCSLAPEQVVETTKQLIAAAADPNLHDKIEMTALMWILGSDRLAGNCPLAVGRIGLLLIESGANVHASGPLGFTALHHAVNNGNTAIANELINRGASIHAVSSAGHTPLISLCAAKTVVMTKKCSMATMLIESKAVVDTVGEEGFTALHWAALQSHKELVALLIDAGPNGQLAREMTESSAIRYMLMPRRKAKQRKRPIPAQIENNAKTEAEAAANAAALIAELDAEEAKNKKTRTKKKKSKKKPQQLTAVSPANEQSKFASETTGSYNTPLKRPPTLLANTTQPVDSRRPDSLDLQLEFEKLEISTEKLGMQVQAKRSEPKQARSNASDECAICKVQPAEIVLLPCKHFCVCSDCAASLEASRMFGCPSCGAAVEDTCEFWDL